MNELIPTLPALPPSWDGFHPLVVHFPIALLAVAPIFVLLGSITGYRSMMFSALVLLVLGVAGAFVATNTGEEAYNVIPNDEVMDLLDPDYEYDDVAIAHGEQSELARNIFAGITACYLVVVILAYARPSSRNLVPRTAIGVVFVLALGYANLVLANAAHLGGELVHVYGVRAVMADPDAEAEAEEEDAGEEDAEESDEETSE
ncbi:MAG: DUF2231 domain-containing protein [Planctomycetota bacterium]